VLSTPAEAGACRCFWGRATNLEREGVRRAHGGARRARERKELARVGTISVKMPIRYFLFSNIVNLLLFCVALLATYGEENLFAFWCYS
jgi:hypothetical protein